MNLSNCRSGAFVPIRNWGMIWRSRSPSGACAIQLSLPVPLCEIASGISASPHSPIAPSAISTARVRRCSHSSHAACGTTTTTA